MDFKQLQSYIEVVRLASFSKAADRLFTSQPTISAHVRQLEEELSTRLIIRDTKNFTVTPKGLELYEYAVNILNMKERMIRNCSIARRRVISIGASSIPSAYILPELLPAFSARYPEIGFTIQQSSSASITKGIIDGLYDIGLVGAPSESEALTEIPLCRDRLVLIAANTEKFRSIFQENAPVERLLNEPFILRESGSGTERRAEEFLAHTGISIDSLHIAARINDTEAIKKLTAAGLGVAVISKRAAADAVASGKLLEYELPGEYAARSFYLIYRKNYILNEDLTALIHTLETTAAND